MGTPKLEELLPLTPLTFQTLLALAGAPRHGYALAREIAAATTVGAPIDTTAIYRVIKRLCATGFVVEEERASGGSCGSRRRTYRLTPEGLRVARAEEERLAQLVGVARRTLHTDLPDRRSEGQRLGHTTRVPAAPR